MAPSDSTQPLNVAFVIDPKTFQRLGPVVSHLSVGLLENVSQITLITPATAALKLSLGPVRVIHHPILRWPFGGRRFREIINALGTTKPTVIHAFSRHSFPLAEDLSLETSAPLVSHIFSAEDVEATPFITSPQVGKLIVASQPLYEYICHKNLVHADKIITIKPGLLTDASPTCFMQSEHIPTLLCMSAFEKGLGVDRLIDAIRILVIEEKMELMLFLLGEGPYEKQLRKQVERHNLIKHITFAQPVFDWHLPMRGADIFVVPGMMQRVDVRLLHALAAGMAVVSGPSPYTDFLVHEQTGLISEASAKDMATQLARLLRDRSLAQSLAARAIEYCKKHHSLSKMAEVTAQVYLEVQTKRTA